MSSPPPACSCTRPATPTATSARAAALRGHCSARRHRARRGRRLLLGPPPPARSAGPLWAAVRRHRSPRLAADPEAVVPIRNRGVVRAMTRVPCLPASPSPPPRAAAAPARATRPQRSWGACGQAAVTADGHRGPGAGDDRVGAAADRHHLHERQPARAVLERLLPARRACLLPRGVVRARCAEPGARSRGDHDRPCAAGAAGGDRAVPVVVHRAVRRLATSPLAAR